MHCMDTLELAHAVGDRVRSARTSRGWTLDQLAAASGVSRRMLVHVEQGGTNPSIGTLLRLGDALGVGLPALVEPPRAAALTVTRAGEGVVLWRGAHGGRAVLVAGTAAPDVVELWDWTLGPGDRYDSEAHAAGTRELLQVLDGSLVVEVGGQSAALEAGDGTAFTGDRPHAYVAASTGARFSLAVHEPAVGAPVRGAVARA